MFFDSTKNGTPYKPSEQEIKQFLQLRKQFGDLYVHGSYWINLALVMQESHRVLQRELALAQKLQFSHIILHPGTTKGATDRLAGIDTMARFFNRLFKRDIPLTIVLENTAYAGMSVGSDLYDFALLYSKLDRPEKIKFCIDTAHAHAYGYDIISQDGLRNFIVLVNETIGIENIVLIHVNDTKELCGSYIDRHFAPGDGIIGTDALKNFVLHPQLVDIPLLLELPILEESDVKRVINEVNNWHIAVL